MDDAVLRAELAKLEAEGADMHAAGVSEVQLPPASARRELGYALFSEEELARLRAMIKQLGLELINDGAAYRIKRQRDFMVWTLETSPLVAEDRGGGEGYALFEAIKRFT